jgi:hypothetical protein
MERSIFKAPWFERAWLVRSGFCVDVFECPANICILYSGRSKKQLSQKKPSWYLEKTDSSGRH